MNTAEYLIKKLEELGINDFFGLPGDYNLNIIYTIKNNAHTKWIGCTNELNAGYAADGYARIKGYGAVVTTYGVGELSAMNAIAGAYSENIPLVHIVGLPDSKKITLKTLIHHNFQDVNYHACKEAYKNVTSKAVLLTKDNAKTEIDNCLKCLVKEKKPVYIAIPEDVATKNISDRYVSYEWQSDNETLLKVSEKIAEKINNSKNPVITADALIKRFDAEIEFKEFCTKTKIPVTNFIMGTNIINADYENFIGGYFGKYKNTSVEKYLNESDCAIFVGPIYSDLNTFGQKLPYKINDQIAIYGTYSYVDGKRYDEIKMSDVLESVAALIEPKEYHYEKQTDGYKPKDIEKVPLTSSYIYPRLQEFFKENDIIFTETVTAPLGIAQIKFANNVNIEFQSLWCSTGWATPATLGAAIAKPNTRIVLLTGDGAHQCSAMETGNLIKYGPNTVVIVLNNKGYAIERIISKDVDDEFNDITQINYAKFARVFDGEVWATRSETDEDFDKALKVTQIMNKLCYIEACTDKTDTQKIVKQIFSSDDETDKISVPETDTFNFDNIVLTDSDESINYETIVHKNFKEIEEN